MRYLVYIFAIVVAFSCNNSNQPGPVEKKNGNEEMIAINKYLVEKDNERIENYIERKKLVMNQTSSGLWYSITKEGTGEMYTDGSIVNFEFESSLLDGTTCYSSEESGPRAAVIGKSEIESGLNEGLKLLKLGSEAIFILPPYLAFGLLGDGKLIPSRSVIVYKIKVIGSN
jgi:FKBP-type peptidyl-prolyl cis-trans isomerase FkpA